MARPDPFVTFRMGALRVKGVITSRGAWSSLTGQRPSPFEERYRCEIRGTMHVGTATGVCEVSVKCSVWGRTLALGD